ncbi:MAG TPA: zinc metalloprotease HtpX [Bryobacteraceae bacterium]|nr:zinc metalloprotease HtpX [Bryobacteraceae bacterium]
MQFNGLKTALLLGSLSAMLLLLGEALGGRSGLYMGFAFAVVMNFASYFFSEKIALMMYRAQPITPEENSQVYRRVYPMVEPLCERMGIPVPKLWLIPEHSPNAFATGRNPSHSSVAFTAGLLELMNDREVEGVLAHELAHVKNRDILTSSIAATIAAAITMVARMAMWIPLGGGSHSDEEDNGGSMVGALFMMILAPIAAMLIQMAISRTREYAADATAAKYTGTPDGLISGLQRLEGYSKRIPMDASPATAHMFIIQPFSGSAMFKLFSTHPPTEERIARLAALRGTVEFARS